MSTETIPRESLFASPRVQDQARRVTDELDRSDRPDGALTVAGVEFDAEIVALLRRIITIVGEGGTVTVGAMPEVITTSTAADLLGTSRTSLMKMVRAGELPSTKVGSHTKLRRDDVLALRRSRMQRQRDALDKLLAMEDELDLP